MTQADADAECLTSPTNMLSLLWRATGSSALVADVLSFSLRISFVLVLVGYIASGMFQYWSTFELEQYNERHLKLTWTTLIPVWGHVIPSNISDGGMFNAFLVRKGQLESCITYKCFHLKIRLNKIALCAFTKSCDNLLATCSIYSNCACLHCNCLPSS